MTRYVLVLVLVCACGDNQTIRPDAGNPGDDAATNNPRAVVVSGSFTPGEVGVMSSLDLVTLEVTTSVAPTGAVAEDPVIRRVGDELFIVNRASGNNVTILDARTFGLVEQLATGAGSNPQDVAVVDDKLYVPAFGTAGVVVVTRGSGATTTIDLSAFDTDGEPNCVSAYRVDTDVYVACELLDANFSPRGAGKIAVIDTTTDTVRTMLTMDNQNPFGVFERMPPEAGGDLVIPTVPSFADVTLGCVERITPGATPVAAGCVVSNQELGGYVARIDFQLLGGTTPMQWMVVSKFDTEARGNLQGYDLESNLLWPDPLSPATQVLVDLVICPNNMVVVADQTMAANGLRVYADGVETTTAPLAIGLKPSSAHGLVCY
jgi:hypothetical protein